MKREPDYEKMTVAEQILLGLQQSIAYSRGEITARTTTLALPAPRLSKSRVVAIRKKTGMSQAVFACVLNVPTKTLQSWEQGARQPKASEARLLQMFEAAPVECLRLVNGVQGVTAAETKKIVRRGRAAA